MGTDTVINPTVVVSGLSTKSTVSPVELSGTLALFCIVDASGAGTGFDSGVGFTSGVVAGIGVGSGVGVASCVVAGEGAGLDVNTCESSSMLIDVESVSSVRGTVKVLGATTLFVGGINGIVDKTEGGTARVVGVALIKVGGGGPIEVGVIVEKVDVSTD